MGEAILAATHSLGHALAHDARASRPAGDVEHTQLSLYFNLPGWGFVAYSQAAASLHYAPLAAVLALPPLAASLRSGDLQGVRCWEEPLVLTA